MPYDPIYFDFEEMQIVSKEKLEAEYHEAYKNGWIQPCTFARYLSNCMYYNNGSLILFNNRYHLEAWLDKYGIDNKEKERILA